MAAVEAHPYSEPEFVQKEQEVYYLISFDITTCQPIHIIIFIQIKYSVKKSKYVGIIIDSCGATEMRSTKLGHKNLLDLQSCA